MGKSDAPAKPQQPDELELTHDPSNANRGTDRGRFLIEHSLRSYGAGRSVLADRNGVLIAGNKTLEEAERQGIKKRIVHTQGDELVVVVRDDLDLAEGGKARELAIADNRTGEVDLEWDASKILDGLGDGAALEKFFNQTELEEIGLLNSLKEKTKKASEEEFGPKDMELQPLESYDYLVVLSRSTMDFLNLCAALDIERVASGVPGKTKTIGLGRCISAERVLAKIHRTGA